MSTWRLGNLHKYILHHSTAIAIAQRENGKIIALKLLPRRCIDIGLRIARPAIHTLPVFPVKPHRTRQSKRY